MALNLEDYGKVYESRRRKYIQTPSSRTGINVERVKPYAGVVDSFTPINDNWFELKVSGIDRSIVIHRQWVIAYGHLRKGEKVEGVILTDATGYSWPLPDAYGSWDTRRVEKTGKETEEVENAA